MIKLIDLLKESLRWDVVKNIRANYNSSEIDEVIQAAENMGVGNTVLWRTTGTYLTPVKAINNPPRTTFRGSDLGALTILKELGITNPTFVFPNSSPHYMFGNDTYVVILKEPYKMYQSTEIDDVMAYAKQNIYKVDDTNGGYKRTQIGTRTDDEITAMAKEGAKTYRDVTDGNFIDDYREIIVQVEKYWLISPSFFTHPEIVGKFGVQDIKKFDDNTTYGDIIFALKKYKKQQDSYLSWLEKNPQPKKELPFKLPPRNV
jgi:hypothetical protein